MTLQPLSQQTSQKFMNYNQDKFNQSLKLAHLTKDSILNAGIRNVTEKVFIEFSQKVDDRGKGLSHSTIYRNEEVHKLFMELSANCQNRILNIKNVKRKRKKGRPAKEILSIYKGLRGYELIRIIEAQKSEIVQLKENLKKVRFERDQLKDQNKNQALHILNLYKQ